MRYAIIVRDLAPGTGLHLVIENLVAGLREMHAVRFFIISPGYYNRSRHTFDDWECEEYPGGNSSGGSSASKASRYYGADNAHLSWLQSRIDDYAPDRIIGFDYNITPFLGLLKTSAPRILNAVDSELLYYSRQFRTKGLSVAGLKHFLAALAVAREHFHKFSAVVAVSDGDSRNMQRWGGARLVHTVPNGVDSEFFVPDASVPKEPLRVVFCGSLSFAPNVQAVEWFLRNCWSLVRERHRDAEFVIIGKNPPSDLSGTLQVQPGVQVTGYVEDVRPHILSAAVSVAPMVSGSGIKNKILEAWALGMPVVATELAVSGLDCRNGRNILIASNPREFAGAVATLLKNAAERQRIGTAARDHVVQIYNWQRSRVQFNSIVEQPYGLPPTPPAPRAIRSEEGI